MTFSRHAAIFFSVCAVFFALLTGALSTGFTHQKSANQAANATGATGTQPGPKSLYTLNVTVTDAKGNFVEGLKPDAFAVFDGKQRVEVASFSDADAPASVVILLDASGSMADTGIKVRIRNALLRFLRNCHEANEFSLIAFNQSPQLILDRSHSGDAILTMLDSLAATKNRGQTALYDALYVALNRASGGKHQRRAILLVTDGQDNASTYTFNEIKRVVRENDAMVYAVAVAKDGHEFDITGMAILKELTEQSGGVVLFPRGEKALQAAMLYVAGALRNQYVLGVLPAPATQKNGWHEIKVKVARGLDAKGQGVKLTARAREGFYDVRSKN